MDYLRGNRFFAPDLRDEFIDALFGIDFSRFGNNCLRISRLTELFDRPMIVRGLYRDIGAAAVGKIVCAELVEQLALVDDTIAVRQLSQLVKDMAGNHDGYSLFFAELLERHSDLDNALRVESVDRLVEHDHFRVSDQCKRYAQSLPHAERKRACILFARVRQSDNAEQLLYIFR